MSADADPLLALVMTALLRNRLAAYAQLAPDLRIARASPNFAALLSDPQQPYLGQPLTEVLDEFVGAEDALRRVLHQDLTSYELERIWRRAPDDSERYLYFRVVSLTNVQPEAGLLLLIEDTTSETVLEQALMQDRNELRFVQADLAKTGERLQRLNEYKSFLISMVAHDLRSPINAIGSYAELALEDLQPNLSAENTHSLNMVAAMSSRLARLIDNLLDLDQIERGQLKLRFEPCACEIILREVVEELQPLITSRQLTLKWTMPPDLPPLEADLARLTQIFYNLLSNAVKYTPDRGEVRVATQVSGETLSVSIYNSGRGLSAAQLQNLFRLYYRTEEARLSKVAGTGLGLFIVKTLAEAHGGVVSAESQLGEGATFTVRLPLKQARLR